MALSPPDLTPPPGNCTLADVIINEVQTGGVTASDEWVELYNPCANPIALAGKLVYRSAAASNDTSTIATLTGKTIGPGGYFLVANSGYTGSATPDMTPFEGSGIADAGGGVGLRDGSGNIVDSMAWGTASNGFAQGNNAPKETSGKSIARQPNGANTHHNDVDFAVSTPTPRAMNQ